MTETPISSKQTTAVNAVARALFFVFYWLSFIGYFACFAISSIFAFMAELFLLGYNGSKNQLYGRHESVDINDLGKSIVETNPTEQRTKRVSTVEFTDSSR